MFALSMQSVSEFPRSVNWIVCRSGTGQRWEGEKGGGRDREGSGADAIGRRSQRLGEGVDAGWWVGSARAGGRALDSLSHGRKGAE